MRIGGQPGDGQGCRPHPTRMESPHITHTEFPMPSARQLCAFAAVGVAGFAAGVLVSTPRSAGQGVPPPRTVFREDPPNRSLDANLWMQVSAEYRACCYQAYNLARRRLTEKVQSPPPGGWARPPAVVLDL